MKPLVLTLTLALLPGMPQALAGGNEPMTMSMPMSSDAMATHMRTMMRPMMADLERLSGRAFDRAFLSMMIPHHASAIDMSQVALPRLRDPQVRAWAQKIISDQRKEIAEMQAHLRTIGGADMARQTTMQRSMGMMDMAQMLRTASRPDRMFLEMMIPHHGSANDMANLALQKSQDPVVLDLAEQIMKTQAGEMHDFKEWLRTRS